MIDPRIPLAELHRHLDGSIRLETILDLGRLHNIPLPAWDADSLRPHVQVTDPQPGVMAFITKFHWPMLCLADADACQRVAYESVEDAAREGIYYIELRFSPWFMAASHSLHPIAVVEAVVDGIQKGVRTHAIRVNLIGILSRTYGTETASKELEALLTQQEAICAIDLAGDEAGYPAELFFDHFRRARDAGWHVTVHAGESAGAGSIWQALRNLGAERIGHAIHAADDPALMDYLAENHIGVESCLTSNVQTSCVTDYPSHPLRTFLQHGILATINTDDPGISNITLPYEYETAAPAAGLTQEQIRQAQKNAIATSFLGTSEKTGILSLFDPV